MLLFFTSQRKFFFFFFFFFLHHSRSVDVFLSLLILGTGGGWQGSNLHSCSVHPQMAGARVAQWVKSLDLTTHTIPIRHGFGPGFVNYKKGCTRLAATSNKVYQLLAHGRWFSPDTPKTTTKIKQNQIPRWQIGGWACQVIMRIPWPWTIVGNMFWECHTLCM